MAPPIPVTDIKLRTQINRNAMETIRNDKAIEILTMLVKERDNLKGLYAKRGEFHYLIAATDDKIAGVISQMACGDFLINER